MDIVQFKNLMSSNGYLCTEKEYYRGIVTKPVRGKKQKVICNYYVNGFKKEIHIHPVSKKVEQEFKTILLLMGEDPSAVLPHDQAQQIMKKANKTHAKTPRPPRR